MSSKIIQPSTLVGIKRLAKSIKTERNIQHVQALNVAAQTAGFQNFKHASNVLQANAPLHEHSGHRIFLTAYWKDKELGGSGRETLTLWLDHMWGDLITTAQLQIPRALSRFKPEGLDHLARHDQLESQSQARRAICAAARTLQFMNVTKLRPSKSYSRALPSVRSNDMLPGSDHGSVWYDRDTKRYLFVDEPYEAEAQSEAAKRIAWAVKNEFTIGKPSWPGMYNPDGGSRLYLITHSKKGVPLDPVISALDRLPPPIEEKTWDGESASVIPYFVSPGAIARTESAKIASQTTRQPATGQRNTVGYNQIFVGPQRRPKGRMPLELHSEVGNLLKSVLAASYHRKGVYKRLDSVRSELDEWVQQEYPRTELPSEQFFDLYYHGPDFSFSRNIPSDEQIRHIGNIQNIKNILALQYPDSAPLRKLIKTLNAAIKSLESWQS